MRLRLNKDGQSHAAVVLHMVDHRFLKSGCVSFAPPITSSGIFRTSLLATLQVSEEAVLKRYDQGWLEEYTSDLDDLMARLRRYRAEGRMTSLGYHGNVVTLWYIGFSLCDLQGGNRNRTVDLFNFWIFCGTTRDRPFR